MFSRLFGAKKEAAAPPPGPVNQQVTQGTVMTMDRLSETLEMLDKKERKLQKDIANELARAKEFTVNKNKRAALQCLKKKKMLEQQLDYIMNNKLRIEDQRIVLEGQAMTAETVNALSAGASQMKKMAKATNIDDVDRVMDEINDTTDAVKQVQEALGQPVGGMADLDEDELLNELDELEAAELDAQLLDTTLPQAQAAAQQPARTQQVAPVADLGLPAAPTGAPTAMPSVPSSAPAQAAGKSAEDLELERLQAEMQLTS